MAWLPLYIEAFTRRCERCGIRLDPDESGICEYCLKAQRDKD